MREGGEEIVQGPVGAYDGGPVRGKKCIDLTNDAMDGMGWGWGMGTFLLFSLVGRI
jgi:hypothetical protein